MLLVDRDFGVCRFVITYGVADVFSVCGGSYLQRLWLPSVRYNMRSWTGIVYKSSSDRKEHKEGRRAKKTHVDGQRLQVGKRSNLCCSMEMRTGSR